MKDDPSRVNAIEVLERFRVSFKLVTFQIGNEQKKIVQN